MRVSVEHREEAAGLSGGRRHYYVDCEVLFSEEEKAIIAARGLQKHYIALDPPVPPPAPTHYVGATLLRAVAPFVMLASCVTGLAIGDRIAMPLFFLSIGMFVVSFFLKRKTAIAERPEQTISFEQLLDYPRFTVFALDPSRAKAVDDALRAKLAALKGLLLDSTDIRSRETFEL
jgi:hypothetical protein